MIFVPDQISVKRSSTSLFVRLVVLLFVSACSFVIHAEDVARDSELSSTSANSSPNDLASHTIRLVQERRWSDVVSMCETAARKGTLPVDLQHRYDLAKLHCELKVLSGKIDEEFELKFPHHRLP